MGWARASVAALAIAWSTAALAVDDRIYIAQVSPRTGPAASIGVPLSQAAHAYIEKVNAAGGVNGRRIEMLDRDDAFNPELTLSHVRTLSQERSLVALLNVVGAPHNGNLVRTGLLREQHLSVVGAFTGATSVRELQSADLYFLRAGVAGEAATVARQLMTMGVTRIALVRANDAFGADAMTQLERSLATHSLKLLHTATYAPATVDVKQAVDAVLPLQPQAIVIFGTGPAAARFIVGYRRAGGGATLIASSAVSADVLVAEAGPDAARGVGLVQVTPPVSKVTVAIVREYLDTLARHGDKSARPSTTGLEGFIAAKLLVEAIRRSGREPTREAVSRELANLGQIDVGGLRFDFSNQRREGSSYVQIGIIGPGGRLMN